MRTVQLRLIYRRCNNELMRALLYNLIFPLELYYPFDVTLMKALTKPRRERKSWGLYHYLVGLRHCRCDTRGAVLLCNCWCHVGPGNCSWKNELIICGMWSKRACVFCVICVSFVLFGWSYGLVFCIDQCDAKMIRFYVEIIIK